MDSLEKIIMEELRCTKCSEIIETNIRYCMEGHNLCVPCSTQILSCPKCKSYKGTGENLAMELLRSIAIFSCLYRNQGCLYWGSINERRIHEVCCDYAVKYCYFSHCFWKDKLKNFKNHCRECHPDHTSEDSCFDQVSTDELELRVDKELLAHGTAFVIRWYVRPGTGKTFVQVRYTGPPSQSKLYYAALTLRIENSRKIFMHSCLHSTDELSDLAEPTIPISDIIQYIQDGGEILDIEITELIRVADGMSPEKAAFAMLRCINCKNMMRGPIHMCAKGHNSCARCHSLPGTCPDCESQKMVTRNLSLERISMSLLRLCRHADAGCDYRGFEPELEEHLKVCLFIPRPCPMRYHKDCLWEGPTKEFIKHCLEIHKEELRTDFQREYVLEGYFSRFTRWKASEVCFVYDRLFRFSYEFDKEKGNFRTGCYYFGDRVEDNSFNYTVSFVDAEGRTKAPKLKGACYQIIEDRWLFNNFLYITLHESTWSKYCDENGDLHFSVNIGRKETVAM